jgi:glycosyltransferase involved in cell wall biosynthesis
MRIAIVASHPVQYSAPLFRELARRHDLMVFFAHRATAADQADSGFGVGFEWDVDLLSGFCHSFLRNVSRRPGLRAFNGCDTPDIGARLTEGHFDAVLLQGWYLKSFIQAMIACKRAGLPVLVRGDSHLGTPRSRLKRAAKELVYPPFLRLFDAALFVGERSRAYWRHYKYPTARMFFSPHCIDSDWFAARSTLETRAALRARLGIAADAKVALFAGKLVAFKRPLDVVAAAARLKQEGVDLVVLIAGAGPLELEILSAARAAGVTLHMLGFCNQTIMPSAYAAADLLVLPSHETWGLVANESLACGRPIVVSDSTGCAPDLATNCRVGKTFAVGDIEGLARSIAEILRCGPSPADILAKSAEYSVDAAVDGIVRAATFVADRRASGSVMEFRS